MLPVNIPKLDRVNNAPRKAYLYLGMGEGRGGFNKA